MTTSIPPYSIIIPARISSTRLPRKPVLQLTPYLKLAEATCLAALATQAQQVVLIADDPVISAVDVTKLNQTDNRKRLQSINCDTNATFKVFEEQLGHQVQNGTERSTAAVTILDLPDDHIVVNVQGDEPLFNPQIIDELVQQYQQAVTANPKVAMASLCVPLEAEQLDNPNSVKVVLDQQQHALYFSRSPLPYTREAVTAVENFCFFKHVGVYCYSVGFLKRYCQLQVTPLSYLESLEQLRALEHGYQITMLPITTTEKLVGVDDPASLAQVQQILTQAKQDQDIFNDHQARAAYLEFLGNFGKVARHLAQAKFTG